MTKTELKSWNFVAKVIFDYDWIELSTTEKGLIFLIIYQMILFNFIYRKLGLTLLVNTHAHTYICVCVQKMIVLLA